MAGELSYSEFLSLLKTSISEQESNKKQKEPSQIWEELSYDYPLLPGTRTK
jgi:hypothetical protein